MRFISSLLLLFSCLILRDCFGAPSYDLNQSLRALQQIRSLIPERFSEQEFDILVDEPAFKKPLHDLCSHKLREMSIPSTCMLGSSNYYLLRWTFSGESVRILDTYLEFEYGPFWKYPTALESLDEMKSTIYKRVDE
jgi:hypothetical protein